MSNKRKLTPTEKEKVREEKRKAEQAVHPDARILVDVDDETDENGNAIVHVRRTTHKVMPRDWKP